jgi:hypothetical protein
MLCFQFIFLILLVIRIALADNILTGSSVLLHMSKHSIKPPIPVYGREDDQVLLATGMEWKKSVWENLDKSMMRVCTCWRMAAGVFAFWRTAFYLVDH